MRPRPHGRGIQKCGNVTALLVTASMRPRPHGRGIPPFSSRSVWGTSCFNEATTARSWNYVFSGVYSWPYGASMRPRPRGRGIQRAVRHSVRFRRASMRPRPHGRGIGRRRSGKRSCDVASMRPRPHGRGIHNPIIQACPWCRASMRPRPHGRGIPDGRRRPPVGTAGFNEATTARAWNSHTCPGVVTPRARFNEATTARSWN